MTTAPEKLPVLTQFVFGDPAFVSQGTSNLVVTKDGKRSILPVPIKSLGVQEATDALRADAPKPSVRLETIEPDTPEGEHLGLTEAALRRIYDHTDLDYLEAVGRHTDHALWMQVIAGLAVDFVDEQGEAVTDPAQIRTALINSGITRAHLDQLYYDIQALTRATEESADFLSGAASDTPEASQPKSKKGRQTRKTKPSPESTTKQK